MMMSVIGKASSNRIDDWLRMFAIFAGVRNPGLMRPNVMHSAPSTIATPGTRVIDIDTVLSLRALIGGFRGEQCWLQ